MSTLLFLPAALCAFLVLVGLACAGLAALALRKQKRLVRIETQGQPPQIAPIPSTRSGTRHRFWLRTALGAGILTLLAGGAGLWSTKPSIGWRSGPEAEWSQGEAPGLAEMIRMRCVPFLEQRSTGMAVAVVTPTEDIMMAFGYPSLGSPFPTGPDTVFEIGSISKTFTGLLLAREIEHGKVSLEDPVETLLPAGMKLPPGKERITLRHLATHTSGLPRMAGPGLLRSGLGMLLFGTDPYAGFGEAQLKTALESAELEFEPGSGSGYSNLGAILLGYALARKSGCSYEELVQKNICESLQMRNTSTRWERTRQQQAAQGYRAILRLGRVFLGLRSDPWFTGTDLGGAGAVRASIHDMQQYLKANMRPAGTPLEQALRAAHQELYRSADGMHSGMFWVRMEGQTLRETVLWHNGGTGGFRSFLGWTETTGVGVVILSNSGESVDELALDLLREIALLQKEQK